MDLIHSTTNNTHAHVHTHTTHTHTHTYTHARIHTRTHMHSRVLTWSNIFFSGCVAHEMTNATTGEEFVFMKSCVDAVILFFFVSSHRDDDVIRLPKIATTPYSHVHPPVQDSRPLEPEPDDSASPPCDPTPGHHPAMLPLNGILLTVGGVVVLAGVVGVGIARWWRRRRICNAYQLHEDDEWASEYVPPQTDTRDSLRAHSLSLN
jgi:hypothetical protein